MSAYPALRIEVQSNAEKLRVEALRTIIGDQIDMFQ